MVAAKVTNDEAAQEILGSMGKSVLKMIAFALRASTDNPFGIGADEVPEFVPTRNELIQLVKYWTKKTIDIDYFYFLWGQAGGEWRLLGYANSRISKIAYLLGNAEVESANPRVVWIHLRYRLLSGIVTPTILNPPVH